MNASVAGYFSVIPAFLLIISVFVFGKYLRYIQNSFTLILLFLSSLIIAADLELYRNWGFRIDSTPLLYLRNPKEASASVDFKIMILLVLIWLVLFSISVFAYFKLVAKKQKQFEKIKPINAFWFLLLLFSLFLPVRGSVGIAPMNTGMVYFSEKNVFANHAAVNPIWNFGFSLSETNGIQPMKFNDDKSAQTTFDALYPKSSTTKKILKTERPNIIIVILESFTAKVIEPLGGLPGITPNLKKIAKDGLLFKNFYATGDRTDKGIPGVISGYPAQPTSSILKYSDRTEKLPSLAAVLKKENYETQWICGFNIDFANMKSYIYHCRFDNIITINDFPTNERNAKWGIHDEFVFERLFAECQKAKQPFLKVFMTLSSHEPFDVPMKQVIPGNTEEVRFLNSIYYTDKSLGKFVEELKKSPIWANTLLVFVADHGARHPGNSDIYVPEKFHIPLIWTGGALAVTDSVITTIAGQTDIASTILAQMKINYDDFKFGKDIFGNNARSYAFYDYNNGFGFLTDSTIQVFDNPSKTYLINTKKMVEKSAETGKSYEQILMNDFINKQNQPK
jgi:phosphoglycerol transferase MdoB-like AlkP superfamily enzyme